VTINRNKVLGMDQIDDIDQILESDLNDISDVALDEESGEDAIKNILLFRKLADDSIAIDADYIDVDYLKRESEQLLLTANSEVAMMVVKDGDSVHESDKEVLLQPPANPTQEDEPSLVTVDESLYIEIDNGSTIAERRIVVETVIQLMINSIEALAEVFSRLNNLQQPTFKSIADISIHDTAIFLPEVFDELAAIAKTQEVIEPFVTDTTTDTASLNIHKTKEEQKSRRLRHQLEDNEDELAVKLMYDEEKVRLEQNRRQRQERTRKREEEMRKAKLMFSAVS
jgi:hypothetical protein